MSVTESRSNSGAPSPLLTWLHLVLRFEGLSLDLTQKLGGCSGITLIGQSHVLLPDGQCPVQTLTGQLKVIHGHLKINQSQGQNYSKLNSYVV